MWSDNILRISLRGRIVRRRREKNKTHNTSADFNPQNSTHTHTCAHSTITLLIFARHKKFTLNELNLGSEPAEVLLRASQFQQKRPMVKTDAAFIRLSLQRKVSESKQSFSREHRPVTPRPLPECDVSLRHIVRLLLCSVPGFHALH